MLACNKTITLVHRIKGTDGDTYRCYQIGSASWYNKLQTAVLDRGAREQRYTRVRFPSLPDGAQIAQGDFMVNGIVTHVSRESDMEGLDYFTILDISNNTRGGGVLLPHWSVIGR